MVVVEFWNEVPDKPLSGGFCLREIQVDVVTRRLRSLSKLRVSSDSVSSGRVSRLRRFGRTRDGREGSRCSTRKVLRNQKVSFLRLLSTTSIQMCLHKSTLTRPGGT